MPGSSTLKILPLHLKSAFPREAETTSKSELKTATLAEFLENFSSQATPEERTQAHEFFAKTDEESFNVTKLQIEDHIEPASEEAFKNALDKAQKFAYILQRFLKFFYLNSFNKDKGHEVQETH